MKISIVGSRLRYWNNDFNFCRESVELVLKKLIDLYKSFEIIVGDEQTGVDKAVVEVCKKLGIPCRVIKRRCNSRECLVERTRKVVELGDEVHAIFPNEPFTSRGSTYALIYGAKIGKKKLYTWVTYREEKEIIVDMYLIKHIYKIPGTETYFIDLECGLYDTCIYLISFEAKPYKPIKLMYKNYCNDLLMEIHEKTKLIYKNT